jgi:hypothetical protein
MHKLLATVLIVTALAVPLSVAAHSEQHFDTINTPHGGLMRMAGPYHLELVTKDNELVLYIMDHGDNNVPTAGGTGKATIQKGKSKEKTTIQLEPAGDNTLKGTGEFVLTPETVIVVFIKLREDEAQSVRFTPLKTQPKSAKKGQPAKSQPAKSQPDESDGHDDHHMHHQDQ